MNCIVGLVVREAAADQVSDTLLVRSALPAKAVEQPVVLVLLSSSHGQVSHPACLLIAGARLAVVVKELPHQRAVLPSLVVRGVLVLLAGTSPTCWLTSIIP